MHLQFLLVLINLENLVLLNLNIKAAVEITDIVLLPWERHTQSWGCLQGAIGFSGLQFSTNSGAFLGAVQEVMHCLAHLNECKHSLSLFLHGLVQLSLGIIHSWTCEKVQELSYTSRRA